MNLYACGECSIDVKGEIETMEEWLKIRLEETILFIILQLLVVLIYFIYPLTVKKYKIIYWSVSEALVIITVLFWGIFIVGPIWLK